MTLPYKTAMYNIKYYPNLPGKTTKFYINFCDFF